MLRHIDMKVIIQVYSRKPYQVTCIKIAEGWSGISTHLEALLFTSFTLLVVSVLAPVAVAVRVVRQERVVCLACRFHLALQNTTISTVQTNLFYILSSHLKNQMALADQHYYSVLIAS